MKIRKMSWKRFGKSCILNDLWRNNFNKNFNFWLESKSPCQYTCYFRIKKNFWKHLKIPNMIDFNNRIFCCTFLLIKRLDLCYFCTLTVFCHVTTFQKILRSWANFCNQFVAKRQQHFGPNWAQTVHFSQMEEN